MVWSNKLMLMKVYSCRHQVAL